MELQMIWQIGQPVNPCTIEFTNKSTKTRHREREGVRIAEKYINCAMQEPKNTRLAMATLYQNRM